MVVVVAEVVDKEINKALVKEVKEFNEGLEKFYLCKVKHCKNCECCPVSQLIVR